MAARINGLWLAGCGGPDFYDEGQAVALKFDLQIIKLVDHAVKAGAHSVGQRAVDGKKINTDQKDRDHQQHIFDQVLTLDVAHN
jgi:hypothetical protein